MEYALWGESKSVMRCDLSEVLILILMEYALWGWKSIRFWRIASVLILILMEYALWVPKVWSTSPASCLNPYSNGICSMSNCNLVFNEQIDGRLNPYSNGICSMRAAKAKDSRNVNFRLNPYSNGICSMREGLVLVKKQMMSLNPYSNGICSMRWHRPCLSAWLLYVLILILMEYALWETVQLWRSNNSLRS